MTDDLPLLAVGDGSLHAVFAPTRGGRLLSLRADGEELLWQNPALLGPDLTPVVPVAAWPAGDGAMDTWANVGGSKTWPAPQGWTADDEWHGPPDQVLDSGPWDVVEADASSVRMRSGVDPVTGLRIERSFAFTGDGRATERISLENHGTTTTTWAPWEVCQVRTEPGGTVLVEGAVRQDEVDLGGWEGTVVSTGTPAGVVLPVGQGVAKRGYRSGTAVSYTTARGTVLRLGAVVEDGGDGHAGAPYPDDGCRFELWTQRPVTDPIAELGGLAPDAHLVELEVLGRRVPLAPGDRRSVTVAWSVTTRGPAGAGRSGAAGRG